MQTTQPISILVVEDNESTRKIILKFLASLGYTADIAVNGLDAVESFRWKNYEMVLMDLQMPEMDGITATDKIKSEVARESGVYPFFVAVTNEVKEADETRYHEVGFERTVFKPVNADKLRCCIEWAIQRKIFIQNLPSSLNNGFACQHPLSVLLVEDEKINARVTVKQLEYIGYGCHHVENGRLAVDAVKNNNYDIVFMDIRMPEMDGFQATDTIRDWFSGKGFMRCPSIVALTTIEMLENKQGHRDGLFDNHLLKPLQIEKLAHTLYVAHQRKELIGQPL